MIQRKLPPDLCEVNEHLYSEVAPLKAQVVTASIFRV